MKKIFLFMLVSIFGLSISANNVQVSNISLENQIAANHTVDVEFDISWENSWRTSSVPNNWDACWVFVKYSVAGGEWHHATLSTSGVTAPYGSSIDISADGIGAFIYRDSNGSGTIFLPDARIRWLYGADGIGDDAFVEVKVFAIEMVYVPEGDYNLGDGESSGNTFHRGDNVSIPYIVDSEGTIDFGTSSNEVWASGSLDAASGDSIKQAFPKGYQSYYCMKYELSQEQYSEFLNCLTRPQQNARTEVDISVTNPSATYVMSGLSHTVYRNYIRCNATLPLNGPIQFYCDANGDYYPNDGDDGQNVPAHDMHWMDLAAYLDWSGLRGMTEMEYEKACRGPNPSVANEYAFGTSNFSFTNYSFNNLSWPNEEVSNMVQNEGNMLIDNNASYCVRCGIFAASSINHTRIETGATYYGIMEMSGNVAEIVITLYSIAGRSYTGLHGDGELDISGAANVDYWPGINGNGDNNIANGTYLGFTGVTEPEGTTHKGGSVQTIASFCEVSNRVGLAAGAYDYRFRFMGGRGVRTAP